MERGAGAVRGLRRQPDHDHGRAALLITATSSSYAKGGAAFEGFITCQGYEGYITDLLFAYPNQQVPVSDLTVPFSPTMYPWTIA